MKSLKVVVQAQTYSSEFDGKSVSIKKKAWKQHVRPILGD